MFNFFTSNMLRKALKSGLVLLTVTLIYLSLSLGLVFWPNSLPFEKIHNASADKHAVATRQANNNGFRFISRDGEAIYVKKVGEDTDTTLIFLHGIASTHQTVLQSAQSIHNKTGWQVLVPDLRGHGNSGGAAFDLAYIGQYEDDLEDLILFLNEKRQMKGDSVEHKLVIGGHSMGGGITLRYALKDNQPKVDGYLLFAPNFGEGPTQRKSSESQIDNAPIYFNTSRMIGLLMLNTLGINLLDSMPIMYFNFEPKMMAYSYASIMSAQPIRPDNATDALQAINKPLLVIIGKADEVFVADAYPSLIQQYTSLGETLLLDNEDHMSILYSEMAANKASDWLKSNF